MLTNVLQPYFPYITLSAAVLSVICLVFAIVALSSNRRLNNRLRQWKDISSAGDLEEVFTSTRQAVSGMRQQIAEMELTVASLQEEMKHKVSTPAMQRYNAFAEVGSDLSYSVALLDDAGDGVVLTSIYGRDNSVTYGKPVRRGHSDYLLTSEEQAVIRRAMKEVEEEVAVKTS